MWVGWRLAAITSVWVGLGGNNAATEVTTVDWKTKKTKKTKEDRTKKPEVRIVRKWILILDI